MNIEYVGKQFDLSEGIKEFTQGKLAKLERFVEDPVEVRVTFETDKTRQLADVHVHHRFGVLQASDESENMRDSVHGAIEKILKQARRSRNKFIDKRRRAERSNHGESKWPVEVLEGASLKAGSGAKVIKSTNIPIKPMSVDEAALVLEASEHDFVVFRDSTSEKISVLYQRRDEHYGLIVPEP
ncbi:MAG: ribosome-associated translation inhibitor RaiA [Acidobacteria bacterium]|nr:ribosome-associated translation inhibitor RaiA [Acidobacteriota bacterium]